MSQFADQDPVTQAPRTSGTLATEINPGASSKSPMMCTRSTASTLFHETTRIMPGRHREQPGSRTSIDVSKADRGRES